MKRKQGMVHPQYYFSAQDLSRLGRDLRRVVIIDNSPQSYIFHPDNAVSATHLVSEIDSLY